MGRIWRKIPMTARGVGAPALIGSGRRGETRNFDLFAPSAGLADAQKRLYGASQ